VQRKSIVFISSPAVHHRSPPLNPPQHRTQEVSPLPPTKYVEEAPGLRAGLAIRNLVKIYDDDAACNPFRKVRARA
jgi:hypothetical protein